MLHFKSLLVCSALFCIASAKTIKITATSDNKFDPDSVTAEKGDTLEFHFQPKNHSVVAGDFEYPCSPLELGSGFFSGFISSSDGMASKIFQVIVNDTEPIPFYSSQGSECAKGMVGIINPSENKTLSDYKKRASGLSEGVTPGRAVYGGDVVSSSDSKSGDKSDDSKDDKDDENAAWLTQVPTYVQFSAIGLAVLIAF
ncbi:hypothetical protein BGZ63DRAFT_351980 [Mariannaea sp. PMI_226]|nr:hypothetical protein BGZ63DRAFT_351980 [Mariannaea sp. PMI_226]